MFPLKPTTPAIKKPMLPSQYATSIIAAQPRFQWASRAPLNGKKKFIKTNNILTINKHPERSGVFFAAKSKGRSQQHLRVLILQISEIRVIRGKSSSEPYNSYTATQRV